MRVLVHVFAFVCLSICVAACDGGSSYSGGGSGIDVSGTWRVVPTVNGAFSESPYTVELSQRGNKVTGELVISEGDGISGVSRREGKTKIRAVVSGNKVNGSIIDGDVRTEFTVSGNPNRLTGKYQTAIYHGISKASASGTVTMSKTG